MKTNQRRAPKGVEKFSPPLAWRIAAEVVAKSGRDHPADAVLRETLRSRLFSQETANATSRTVFNYYRWYGWLARARPLLFQINHAVELAATFASQPETFSNQELSERAVLGWLSDEMEMSPDWLRAIQSEPKLWLRARRGQGRALEKKLGSTGKSLLPDAVWYQGNDDLFRRAEFHAGEFEIQDISSQAVGWYCAPRVGETWWDACAGAGGKTLHLAELMQNKGLIWASDRSARRLRDLKRRAARAGVFNYRLVAWDGGKKLPTKTKFDGVLVDAPCSGVGTWQRNPHARWTTTLEDVRELAAIQRRLLNNVASAVKPGGKLIYSVCTLTHAETSEVVDAFSKSNPEFVPLPLPPLPVTSESGCALSNAATATVSPQIFGGNGMFVAAWRRAVV